MTAGHVIVYCAPVSAVEGPLMTGADGVVQGTVAGLTVNSAVALAPPRPAGSVAVMVVAPTAEPTTVKLAEWLPAAMSTDGGIAAMLGFDDDNVTVVFDPTFELVCTAYVVDSLTSITRLFGRIASVRLGILIAPLTRVREAGGVSPVVPPWFDSTVPEPSVSVIEEPGAAEGERVNTRCAI